VCLSSNAIYCAENEICGNLLTFAAVRRKPGFLDKIKILSIEG
jgi:hypothetical protein